MRYQGDRGREKKFNGIVCLITWSGFVLRNSFKVNFHSVMLPTLSFSWFDIRIILVHWYLLQNFLVLKICLQASYNNEDYFPAIGDQE